MNFELQFILKWKTIVILWSWWTVSNYLQWESIFSSVIIDRELFLYWSLNIYDHLCPEKSIRIVQSEFIKSELNYLNYFPVCFLSMEICVSVVSMKAIPVICQYLGEKRKVVKGTSAGPSESEIKYFIH